MEPPDTALVDTHWQTGVWLAAWVQMPWFLQYCRWHTEAQLAFLSSATTQS